MQVINLSKMKEGFTLVELLVVISIITLLSSVVVTATQQARDRANISKVRSDVREIMRAIIIAQDESGQRLVQFAGPEANWTSGFCHNAGLLPTTQACYDRVNAAMTKIETATDGIYPVGRLPRRDPWGIPYQMDANFGENIAGNYCITDSFYLVRADGVIRIISNPSLPPIPRQPRNIPETLACP